MKIQPKLSRAKEAKKSTTTELRDSSYVDVCKETLPGYGFKTVGIYIRPEEIKSPALKRGSENIRSRPQRKNVENSRMKVLDLLQNFKILKEETLHEGRVYHYSYRFWDRVEIYERIMNLSL